MEKISWADRVRNGEVLQRVKEKRKYPAYGIEKEPVPVAARSKA